MRFGAPKPRPGPREAIVPMINVVFLLLIFFLMSATIALPPPFEMRLPEGEAAEEAGGAGALFVGADGAQAFGSARGEAVYAAIAARDEPGDLEIRADAGLPAADLAGVLARLGAAGLAEVHLVVVRP